MNRGRPLHWHEGVFLRPQHFQQRDEFHGAKQLALVARALGSAARLELLDFLAQGERTVENLAKVSGLSVANTSKHLQQLRQAGLVEARREGLHVYYSMSGEDVQASITAMRDLAETRMAEVDRVRSQFPFLADADRFSLE